MSHNKCFACGKKLGKYGELADTRDDQVVLVGSECSKHIMKAGSEGYVPLKGGARLFMPVLPENLKAYYEKCEKRYKASNRLITTTQGE